jgi:hypothetical protein
MKFEKRTSFMSRIRTSEPKAGDDPGSEVASRSGGAQLRSRCRRRRTWCAWWVSIPQGAPQIAGQQCGVVFDAHHGARRFGAAFCLPSWVAGGILVGFVVVDPDSSVVPVSL